MAVPSDMYSGVTHKSNNFGDFDIVQYKNKREVLIKFLRTNHQTVVCSSNIRKGKVRDKSVRTVYGVGFLGEGKYGSRLNGGASPAYSKWVDMIRRCKDESHRYYKYYSDCEICYDWLNFQNFAEWYFDNVKGDNVKCDLDKDVKGCGSKLYSPDTCSLIPHKENLIEATAKKYRFKNSSGEVVNIYNLNEFCKTNGLSSSHMYSVFSGKRKSHRGWVAA